MAPTESRVTISQTFQFTTCFGILAANLVNYFTVNLHPNCWRVSLGFTDVPAIILLLGGVFICSETPVSLVEQGKFEEAGRVLVKIRGTQNVDAETDDIKEANEIAQTCRANLLRLFSGGNLATTSNRGDRDSYIPAINRK
jgi:hypothetical protein